MSRKKILFFSHAVTMAHFTRPLQWIESLDPAQYDIYLASSLAFRKMLPEKGVTFIEISCIESAKFSKIVNQAGIIYDSATFEKHIDEDLEVMARVKPDLVIGDFRHSLSVSCRLQKVKYMNITNAYWSPDTQMDYPLPEIPIVRKLGEGLANILVKPFIGLALKINFFRMVFEIRKSLKRVSLHFTDYRQIITDGDVTLYFDTSALVPLKKQTPHKRFMGPLIWSSPVALPYWWSQLKANKKKIFLSLGSSGPAHILPRILRSLASFDVEVIVALAGTKMDLPEFDNVHITDFLPMEEVMRQSSLVICNGGSPMCHAALSYGVPSIGIICNNDQLLNMSHIQKRGAGLMLRYWNITEAKICGAVNEIFNNSSYKKASEEIQKEFAEMNVVKGLQDIIKENIPEERTEDHRSAAFLHHQFIKVQASTSAPQDAL